MKLDLLQINKLTKTSAKCIQSVRVNVGGRGSERSSFCNGIGNCSFVSQQASEVPIASLEEMDYNAHTHNSLDTLLNSVQVAPLHCYFRYAASAICWALCFFLILESINQPSQRYFMTVSEQRCIDDI